MNIKLIKNISNDEKNNFIKKCNQQYYLHLVNSYENFENVIKKICKKAEFFVVYDDIVRVGYIVFYCNNYEKKEAYISLICISEEYQKKGIGKLLIDACVEFCKNLDFCKIRLEVKKENQKAYNFYKKLGFMLENKASENSDYLVKFI